MTIHRINENDETLRKCVPFDYLIFNDKEDNSRQVFWITKNDGQFITYVPIPGEGEHFREYVNFENGDWDLLIIPDNERVKFNIPLGRSKFEVGKDVRVISDPKNIRRTITIIHPPNEVIQFLNFYQYSLLWVDENGNKKEEMFPESVLIPW